MEFTIDELFGWPPLAKEPQPSHSEIGAAAKRGAEDWLAGRYLNPYCYESEHVLFLAWADGQMAAKHAQAMPSDD